MASEVRLIAELFEAHRTSVSHMRVTRRKVVGQAVEGYNAPTLARLGILCHPNGIATLLIVRHILANLGNT